MTDASRAQDPTEARGPGDRGWFQPLDRPPAADVEGAQNGPGAVPGGTGEPEETAAFLRQGTIETQPSEQISVIRPAEQADDNELPTAVQAPLARSADPRERDRPADITRPELILNDTVVDIAGSRGGRHPHQAGVADGGAAPADAGSPPDGKPGKKNRSVFGPEPASRPDVLTNADTVVMPSLKGQKGSLAGQSAKADEAAANAAAVKQHAITAMVAVGTNAAFAEATTQILPTAEPSQLAPAPDRAPPGKAWVKRDRPPAEPPSRYIPGRRTTMISRLILLAILTLQAVLSLRLRNTAFEDESLYLYAGHMELQHLLHGAALQGQYSVYFSGSPVLYPVLAAALDQVGGLALARALSLAEMLAVTTLLYMLTRRLFNERAALCAAALFAVTEAAVFLGNFATYDATCLFLLALAAWIAVRTAAFRWPWFLLAALPAALAVGVKYAGLLFVPTIAVLPVLAGWPERGRRLLWYPPAFAAAVAGLLYGALRLGGKTYMNAISSTTTNRAQGIISDGTILREAAEWGGVLFLAAVFGTVAYVWRVRTEPDEKIAPAGGRWRRALLGTVLTGTALLAPAYQAHLHTDISFLKHIGFGLFFAAPMAGFGLARIMGDYFRRPQIGIAVWSLALVLGIVQSSYLFHVWPSSGPFVSTFARYLEPNAHYLVEVPEVPIYYLMGNKDAQPKQFTSTFVIVYINSKGQMLTGPAGFTAAVHDGYFQVIAYNNTVTQAVDGALAQALNASHAYYLAAKVNLSDSLGPMTYYIWVKGHKPTGSAARKS